MLKVLRYFLLMVLLFTFISCATSGPTEVRDRQYGAVKNTSEGKILEKVMCKRPCKIKVTVGKIRCKSASCKSQPPRGSGLFQLYQMAGTPTFDGIGKGLKDMFYSALRSVECFRIFDREAMEEIRQEMRLAGKRNLKMEAADYIILASVTSINFSKTGGSVGGGGLFSFLGGVGATKASAELGMDVRVVKVKTGEVVFSKTYQSTSTKLSYGLGGAGAAGGIGFGGGLSGLSGTPMEEVARDIIIKATYDIVKYMVPASNVITQRIKVE